MKLLQRASLSLKGHIALFEAFFAAPLAALFLFQSYSRGELTIEWAVHVIAVWAVLGAVGAIVFWYTLTSSLVKRRTSKLAQKPNEEARK